VSISSTFYACVFRQYPFAKKSQSRTFQLCNSGHKIFVQKTRIDEIDGSGQFHQHFTQSFYTCRSRKALKGTDGFTEFLCFWDLRVNMLVKLTPAINPTERSTDLDTFNLVMVVCQHKCTLAVPKFILPTFGSFLNTSSGITC